MPRKRKTLDCLHHNSGPVGCRNKGWKKYFQKSRTLEGQGNNLGDVESLEEGGKRGGQARTFCFDDLSVKILSANVGFIPGVTIGNVLKMWEKPEMSKKREKLHGPFSRGVCW